MKPILAERGAPAEGFQSAVGALKKDPGRERQKGMGKGQQSQGQVVLLCLLSVRCPYRPTHHRNVLAWRVLQCIVPAWLTLFPPTPIKTSEPSWHQAGPDLGHRLRTCHLTFPRLSGDTMPSGNLSMHEIGTLGMSPHWPPSS